MHTFQHLPQTDIRWQPTTEGTLLRVRPITINDFEPLFAAAADPLIWAQHPEPTRWQPVVFRRYFDGAIQCGGGLVVESQSTGHIIGSSRFVDWRPQSRSVEIGYSFLVRACWGGAFNRELKTLMLAHAFQHVDSVWFVVGEHNWRSRKAMEKIGGVLRPRESAPVSGDLSQKVAYVIQKPPV